MMVKFEDCQTLPQPKRLRKKAGWPRKVSRFRVAQRFQRRDKV